MNDSPFMDPTAPFIKITPWPEGSNLERYLVRDGEGHPIGLTLTIVGVGDFTIPIVPTESAAS